jgi:hypothetical protein
VACGTHDHHGGLFASSGVGTKSRGEVQSVEQAFSLLCKETFVLQQCSCGRQLTANLLLTSCPAQAVPDAIGTMTAVTRLELDMDCDSPDLQPTLQLPSHLTQISNNISCLASLQHITIRSANQLRSLPDVFGSFVRLQELKLVGECLVTTDTARHYRNAGCLRMLEQQVLYGE